MTTPDAQTPDPLPTVRWDERTGGPAIVLGNGETWWTVLAHRGTTDEVVKVYGPHVKSLNFNYGEAIRAALAAALTPSPTPREIADHIDRGGRVERWDVPVGQWRSVGFTASFWRNLPNPDAPALGYRLVPLPPAPRWETVQVPWERAYVEQMDVEWPGGDVAPIGDTEPSNYGWEWIFLACSAGGSGLHVKVIGGTVPVRQEVPQ